MQCPQFGEKNLTKTIVLVLMNSENVLCEREGKLAVEIAMRKTIKRYVFIIIFIITRKLISLNMVSIKVCLVLLTNKIIIFPISIKNLFTLAKAKCSFTVLHSIFDHAIVSVSVRQNNLTLSIW